MKPSENTLKGFGMDPNNPTFYISEMYASLQGESIYAGQKCLFIRLTGCDLRCTWCDSTFSFKGGTTMKMDEILAWVDRPEHDRYNLVEITGGEPLAQVGAKKLINALDKTSRTILVETAGKHDLDGISPTVYLIPDVKMPGSGEYGSFSKNNIEILREHGSESPREPYSNCELKFVILDRNDFDHAIRFISEHDLDRDFLLTFSPVFGKLMPGQLADWIIESNLQTARLQLQMHKLLWTGKADFGMAGVKHVQRVDFLSGEYHVLTPQEGS